MAINSISWHCSCVNHTFLVGPVSCSRQHLPGQVWQLWTRKLWWPPASMSPAGRLEAPKHFRFGVCTLDRLHLDTYIKDDYTRVYQYFGISRGEMHLFSNNFESTGSRQPGKGVQEEGSPFLLQADIEGIQWWCYQTTCSKLLLNAKKVIKGFVNYLEFPPSSPPPKKKEKWYINL